MNAYLGCLSILKLHYSLKILFQEFFTYSRHKLVSDVWFKVFSSDPCGASAWLLILRLVFFILDIIKDKWISGKGSA